MSWAITSACAMPNPAWHERYEGGSGSSSILGSTGVSESQGSTTATTDGTTGGGSQSGSGTTTGVLTEGTTATTATTTDTDGATTDGATTDGATTDGATTDATTTDVTTTDVTTDATTEDSSSSGGESCPCAVVEVHLDDGVFVLSDAGALWKYVPSKALFQEIGPLGCAGVGKPFSMAVDRGGKAWVLFESPVGALRQIDVDDPSNCIDPGYVPGQSGVFRYGMAFVSQDIENPCEDLYGNTYNGGALSEFPGAGSLLKVDPADLLVDLVGPTTFNGAELTGTGDGRLYMFGGVKDGKLVEVDKVTAQYLETIPIGALDPTNAFAFAYFAGDFFFFTESKGLGSMSKVTRFDYDGDQSLVVVVDEAPIRVVGAGVSTCVPVP